MKGKFISAAVSRSVALIFLQVHIHLDNSNQKKKKERTDLWDSSAAKKQGTELTLRFMQNLDLKTIQLLSY